MKQILRASVAAALLACVASANAQRGSGPVTSSDVGVSGRYVPEAPATRGSSTSSSSSSASERRATRSLIRLGIYGIAGLGAAAGGTTAKLKRKHTDGRAKGRGVVQSSNVPPGSTRFR